MPPPYPLLTGRGQGGESCVPDSEAHLKVTRSATHIAFMGTGKDPDFYSFEATLNAAGTEMAGNITNLRGGSELHDGTFTAKLNGPPNTKKCIPKPKPPPPPPPPPPHPTTHALLWPLPTSYSNGSATLVVLPSADFFAGATGSALLKEAFARYTELTFPHPVAPVAAESGGGALTGLTVTVGSIAEVRARLQDCANRIVQAGPSHPDDSF